MRSSRSLLAAAVTVAASLVSARALAAQRYDGTARNGGYSGGATLDVAPGATADSVTATLTFHEPLSGAGTLAGVRHGDTLRLRGDIASGGRTYVVAVVGVTRGERFAGAYGLHAVGSSDVQRGELDLAADARSASTSASTRGLDPHVVGTWALVVPGAAWTEETDHGTYVTRVEHASVGAPGGVLTVQPDGRYTWRKQGRSGSGMGRPFHSAWNNQDGWLMEIDGERYYARWAEGRNGGMYLHGENGWPVYSASPLR